MANKKVYVDKNNNKGHRQAFNNCIFASVYKARFCQVFNLKSGF